jgi:UDP-N-acetylmuramate dehydrogenase
MVALTFHLFKWSPPHQPIVGAMIEENISLKEYTTFRIGGPARFFSRVKTVSELQEALAFAKQKSLPVFILGGGSNILISDEGFAGLVIKIEIRGINIKKEIVTAGAGVVWDELVAYAVKNNLRGVENLSFIPGTVGAAPVQNIGAYGAEVKDVISWVEAVHSDTGEIKKFKNTNCQFAYRYSFFKTPEGKKYIITSVEFTLSKDAPLNTSYKDITEYISTHSIQAPELTVQRVRSIVIDIRTKKLPDWGAIGTAGSFFKNPIVSKEKHAELLQKFPEIISYSFGEKIKLSAAWLLDKLCSFKGYRDGDVGVYKNQALVLVNFGSASAFDIKSLADKMSSCVKEKTGIALEREVEYIG